MSSANCFYLLPFLSRTQFGQSGAANDQWVTPNRRTSVPTDFGKRRVHSGGTQSGSGHWFTGEDGRKVRTFIFGVSLKFLQELVWLLPSVLHAWPGAPPGTCLRVVSVLNKFLIKWRPSSHFCFSGIWYSFIICFIKFVLQVYVSKNGQELTGRDAYKQYKKVKCFSILNNYKYIFTFPGLFCAHIWKPFISHSAWSQNSYRKWTYLQS